MASTKYSDYGFTVRDDRNTASDFQSTKASSFGGLNQITSEVSEEEAIKTIKRKIAVN